MCDTMVAVGNATKDGKTLFAKNSDRDSNEPQIFVRYPRRKYDISTNPILKTTYIQIPQAEQTYEVVLSRPDWIWGCEMGFNEFGVIIGNEAVFTKQPKGKPSLLGMDMIRLALERRTTAHEALDYIIELLGRYGQGGNCSAEKKMEYHNSFIVADKREAYVLETAGKYWAYKQIKDGVYAISNGLTLENDFDDCHPELLKDSIDKRLCHGIEDFSFCRMYSDPLFTKFSRCAERRKLALDILKKDMHQITTDTMRRALCAHNGRDGSFETGSMRSICCHAGGLISSQTTASLIGNMQDGEYWYTAGSLPCVSLFKPVYYPNPYFPYEEGQEAQAVDNWRQHEQLVRMFLDKRLDCKAYRSELAMTQAQIDSMFAASHHVEIQEKCFALDTEFTERFSSLGATRQSHGISGNLIFKNYWSKTNKAFKQN